MTCTNPDCIDGWLMPADDENAMGSPCPNCDDRPFCIEERQPNGAWTNRMRFNTSPAAEAILATLGKGGTFRVRPRDPAAEAWFQPLYYDTLAKVWIPHGKPLLASAALAHQETLASQGFPTSLRPVDAASAAAVNAYRSGITGRGFAAALLFLAGIITLIMALTADTTVSGGISNLSLMHQQLMYVVLGVGAVLGGIIVSVSGRRK